MKNANSIKITILYTIIINKWVVGVKYFCRLEADRVRIFKLKKGPRQMVTINGRLYRIDDRFMLRDKSSGDAMIIYPIDSTQPILPRAKLIDPDMTRAYIDYAKIGKSRKKIWQSFDIKHFERILIPVLIVGGILWGFLSGVIG